MRRSVAITGSLAAGVLAVGLAVPAIAATSPDPVNGTCTGEGPAGTGRAMAGTRAGTSAGTSQGTGQQHRHSATTTQRGPTDAARPHAAQQDRRSSAGSGTSSSTIVVGTLTAAQRTALAAMAEEEKMAHDVYVTLAQRYPELTQLSRIPVSETQHLTALRTLMTRYDVADPTLGRAVGDFESSRMQSLYDSLVAGATTSQAALAAGVTIEKTDIADLTAALVGVTAQDVRTVYTHLRTASQHHLAAFGG